VGKLESSIPGATATRRVLLILFVPSADRAGKNLTNQDEWKRLAMEFFGGHCGGATAMPRAEGIWRDDENNAAVASEVAARVLFYRHGASVDTILAHPNLVKAFDALAARLTPGHTSFEYRWAALHMRKKGANVKLRDEEIDGLQWTGPLKFTVASLPAEEGVYSLFEQGTCLFVGALQNSGASRMCRSLATNSGYLTRGRLLGGTLSCRIGPVINALDWCAP
jgi:hypothetical protein